jgi:chaperonin GroEL (HSP60 family)
MEQVSNAQQSQGANARELCIHIAKEMSDLVKHTLGPMGLDNMLVDPANKCVITNDGATIFRESDIDHAVAKVIMQVARTQEETCHDGTTTGIILTGELMNQAAILLKKKIHPTKIAMGYQIAAQKAEEFLLEMGVKADDDMLNLVAQTAMTGKSAEKEKEHLADICVNVAQSTSLDNINIIRRPGGRISDSVAIAGLLVNREKCHHDMPDEVKNAKIALIDVDISLPEFAEKLQVQVRDNIAVQQFIESRKEQLAEIAEVIISSGANVVLCKKDIDSFIQETFAKNGIYAARRVYGTDLELVAKSTGARIISNIDNLNEKDLGKAGLLEEIEVNDNPLIKITETPSDGAVSVLIRAPTQHVVDEIKRAFDDAIGVVSIAIEDGEVLPGGGAPYMALATRLKEYATTVGGREQMAVEAFATALEVIPMTLAENSGLDPLDAIIALRKAHSEDNGWQYGVNVEDGGCLNMLEVKVIEPKRIVSQAIRSATDTASQLIRIEKIISAKKGSEIGDDGFEF